MSNITAIGNSSLLDPTWDTDCFNKFVDELAADITGSCMIPMNLPRQEVQNIVRRAKKWFYKNYEYSVQENFLVIPAAMFESDHFKYSRSFTLPAMDPVTGGGEIFSVFETDILDMFEEKFGVKVQIKDKTAKTLLDNNLTS